jgi:hypothetical protein
MATIQILGHTYTLDLSEDNRDIEGHGSTDCLKQVIQIASNAHSQEQRSTLLHEIIEVLNFQLELKLEHQKITALAEGLYQVLGANDMSSILEEIREAANGKGIS